MIARGLLALLCAFQAIATVAIDLNQTHATNPLWPRHARFHLVWQVASTSLLSALEIALLWWPGPDIEQRFYLAAVLTCIPLLGFLTALISRKAFDGALSDPNGIPPARMRLFKRILRVDLNLAAVAAALLVLAVIVGIYAH
jgi:hypothetical protein